MQGSADASHRYLAAGIPQGLIVDPDAGSIAGAVRRGGEIVSLDRGDYETWLLLLTPLALSGVEKAAQRMVGCSPIESLQRLRDRELVLAMSVTGNAVSDLGRIRPIPLGIGMGNDREHPERFGLQNSVISRAEPVVLDAPAIMLWWEFDGLTSLETAIENVASKLPDVATEAVQRGAVILTHDLMRQRMLYLDVEPERERKQP